MQATGVIIERVKLLPKDTIDLVETILRQNGVTIYARINQQEEANRNGISIRPVIFLMFGNPVKGAGIMMENPAAALDLPLKIISWQDEMDDSFIAFNDAQYLAKRFNLSNASAMLIEISTMLSKTIKQIL